MDLLQGCPSHSQSFLGADDSYHHRLDFFKCSPRTLKRAVALG
jgi:hypothetical protein